MPWNNLPAVEYLTSSLLAILKEAAPRWVAVCSSDPFTAPITRRYHAALMALRSGGLIQYVTRDAVLHHGLVTTPGTIWARYIHDIPTSTIIRPLIRPSHQMTDLFKIAASLYRTIDRLWPTWVAICYSPAYESERLDSIDRDYAECVDFLAELGLIDARIEMGEWVTSHPRIMARAVLSDEEAILRTLARVGA